jgi:hypothetical protein
MAELTLSSLNFDTIKKWNTELRAIKFIEPLTNYPYIMLGAVAEAVDFQF